MSSRIRFLLLRSLPWLIGLTVGAAIIYLQKAGTVRTDREVLLQLPRSLPEGYSGTIGVRAFVYQAADSGDPRLITPPATLSLHGPDGRSISKPLKPSQAGGLEATVSMPEPIQTLPVEAKLVFDLAGEKHLLRAEIRVASRDKPLDDEVEVRDVSSGVTLERCAQVEAGVPPASCHPARVRFMPRFGGCVAGRPCRNAHEEMKPWPESQWSKMEDLHTLPRYAVTIERWQVSGTAGDPEARANLSLRADSAIAIDDFVDGVWRGASSLSGASSLTIEGDRTERYQFRPDPFDVGAASVFVFDPSDPGPSLEALARREATVVRMPAMWSWTTQLKRDAAVRGKEAKAFFVLVVVLTALGAIGLLLVRWKSTRPRAGLVSLENEKLLLGRTTSLVAGVFALVLLFLLATGLYLMRDLLGF